MYLFLEREEREKERERNINVERNIDQLPLAWLQLGTWAIILTWNQMGDLSVCGMMPNPLNHTSQGYLLTF